MNPYTLMVDCSDREGLVYHVTGILFNNNCNIISNGEFVEKSTNHFFMRTVFSGEADTEKILEELKKALPPDSTIRLSRQEKKDIIILATKEHHCLGDLLLRYHFNELNARILAVISNHEILKELTDKFEIPFHFIPHEGNSRGNTRKRLSG